MKRRDQTKNGVLRDGTRTKRAKQRAKTIRQERRLKAQTTTTKG